ncbi:MULTISPECIES: hypothetical protein [Moraxella]|uniref:hypothetical protein n=1 Tax=Moraxella TaxID=475 RepID=UPI000F84F79B|nr:MULTISPECIES: hypothetical protein [Moraxella]AZQ89444.1 hypothetical protein EJK50_0872 [Moraxella catarrhalis]MCG6817168.1 hypothetical protein [Moraxella catarrhalis]
MEITAAAGRQLRHYNHASAMIIAQNWLILSAVAYPAIKNQRQIRSFYLTLPIQMGLRS